MPDKDKRELEDDEFAKDFDDEFDEDFDDAVDDDLLEFERQLEIDAGLDAQGDVNGAEEEGDVGEAFEDEDDF